MRRLTNWIAGVLGGIVAYRLWKRRRKPAAVTAPAAEETDDRAEELRAKLAESRASEEPSPAEPSEPANRRSSLEERRRRVHEEGRAAIDQDEGGGEHALGPLRDSDSVLQVWRRRCRSRHRARQNAEPGRCARGGGFHRARAHDRAADHRRSSSLLAVPSYLQFSDNANQATAKSNAKEVAMAAGLCFTSKSHLRGHDDPTPEEDTTGASRRPGRSSTTRG